MKTSLTIALIFVALAAYSQEEMKQDSSVTAIENEIASTVCVYPNPFRDNLTIQAPENVQHFIIDQTGRRIDLNTAPSGLYFIVFSNRRTKFVQKVIKG